MSKPSLFFGATVLQTRGIQGILKPDEHGYWTVPLGGLDVYNDSGIHYDAKEARCLFEAGGDFHRRVTTSCLKGEEGHPVMTPGMSEEAWINRMLTIYEPNTSFHIAEVWLDGNSVKDRHGNPVLAIMGKVKGSGALGPAFDADMNNSRVDVCFSIRAFSEQFQIAGVTHRILREVVTFDRPTEPGIHFARKWNAPSVESLAPQARIASSGEHLIDIDMLHRAVESKRKSAQMSGVALESSYFTPDALFAHLARDRQRTLPAACRWAAQ